MARHYWSLPWRALGSISSGLGGPRRRRIPFFLSLWLFFCCSNLFGRILLDFRTFIWADSDVFCLESRSNIASNLFNIAAVDCFRGETRIFVVTYIVDVGGSACRGIACWSAYRGKMADIFRSVDRVTMIARHYRMAMWVEATSTYRAGGMGQWCQSYGYHGLEATYERWPKLDTITNFDK